MNIMAMPKGEGRVGPLRPHRTSLKDQKRRGGSLPSFWQSLAARKRPRSLRREAHRENQPQGAAERLKLLLAIQDAFSRSTSLDALLELILDRAFEHLRAEEAVIFLKAEDGQLHPTASRSLCGPEEGCLGSPSLMREVAEKGAVTTVLDASADERLAGAESVQRAGVRSLLAVPLLDSEDSLGMIVLSSRFDVRFFDHDELDLLVSLASVAALRIRGVWLSQEACERRRLAEELALARRTQVALFSQRMPKVQGYDVFAGSVPSRTVSGDFYKVAARREEGECVFFVADVSGKGMAASLLAASLEALIARPLEEAAPPDVICARVSHQLFSRTQPEKFATAFLAVLDPATGALRYASAGHNPALLLRARGEVEKLPSTGLPLGLLGDASYAARETILEVGDTLVIYTDGITEAANPEGEQYGLERLIEVCRRQPAVGLEKLAGAIEEDLVEFVRGVPFADDRTIVMARRLAG